MGNLAIFVKKGTPLSIDQKESLDALEKKAGLDAYKRVEECSVNEMILAFDATGSMEWIWREASEGIEKLVKRVSELIPGIRISLIAYRDYCDGEKLIEELPLTANVVEIEAFIRNIVCDGGGDFPEAVEVALEKILQAGEGAFGVVVGDAPPHGVVDDVRQQTDYRDIITRLANQGKQIYTVFARPSRQSEGYEARVTRQSFEEIAQKTGARFFGLDQIDELIDALSAAAARRVNKVSALKALIKNEQGGKLTARQQELLAE